MEKTNRITYRFDRNGRKIDEHGSSSNTVDKSKLSTEGRVKEAEQTPLQSPMKSSTHEHRTSANMELEQLEQLIRSTDAAEQVSVPRRSRSLSEQPSDTQFVQENTDLVSVDVTTQTINSHENQKLYVDSSRHTVATDDEKLISIEAGQHNAAAEGVHQITADGAQHMTEDEEKKAKQFLAIDALDELELWLKETDRKSKRLDERMKQTAREQVPSLPSIDDHSKATAVRQDAEYDGDYAENDGVTKQQARPTLTWMQGALSVVSAIISGCLIGYLLLTLVFGFNVWPISSLFGGNAQELAAEASKTGTLPASANDLQTKPDEDTAVIVQEGATQALNAQSYQYYVLQAGVFTKENTRDEVINSLKQSGYAAEFTLDDNNRYVVYAGLAASENDANYVQGSIKGIETYRKPLTLSLPDAMPFNGEAELLEQYFEESNSLIKMYSDLVAVQLEQTSLSPIGEAAQSAWQSSYNSWFALSEQIADLWGSDEQLQQATQLQQALQEADAQLLNYQAEPKTKYLWNVQRALVKSVLVQKDWFVQVNAL